MFKTSFAVTYSLSGKHTGEYGADCLILPVAHVMSGDLVGHRWQSSLPFLRCGAQTLHKYFPPQKHVRQLCSTDPGYKKHLSGFPPLPAALWRHRHIKTRGMINDALSHECWLPYSAAGKKKSKQFWYFSKTINIVLWMTLFSNVGNPCFNSLWLSERYNGNSAIQCNMRKK